MPTWELIVHGRVQGVGFRWFAQHCAVQCGINGYAQNLPDGTVKIIASGANQEFSDFCRLISRGNRHAVVHNLDISPVDHAEFYDDFEIR